MSSFSNMTASLWIFVFCVSLLGCTGKQVDIVNPAPVPPETVTLFLPLMPCPSAVTLILPFLIFRSFVQWMPLLR